MSSRAIPAVIILTPGDLATFNLMTNKGAYHVGKEVTMKYDHAPGGNKDDYGKRDDRAAASRVLAAVAVAAGAWAATLPALGVTTRAADTTRMATLLLQLPEAQA